MATIATVDELAAELGITAERATAFISAGLPTREDGSFDVDQSAIWCIDRIERVGHPDGELAARREIDALHERILEELVLEMNSIDVSGAAIVQPLRDAGYTHVTRDFYHEWMRRLKQKIRQSPAGYAAAIEGVTNDVEARQRLANTSAALLRSIAQIGAEMEAAGWHPLEPPPGPKLAG